MPGPSGGESLVATNPTVIFPYLLARAFRQERGFAAEENRYKNGEVQRSSLVATSRKRWSAEFLALSPEADLLRAFHSDQDGALIEFWFYDLFETSPKFSYDETGSAAVGRYAVRFNGPLEDILVSGSLSVLRVTLIEVS